MSILLKDLDEENMIEGPSIYIGNRLLQPDDRIFNQSVGGFLFGGGNVGERKTQIDEGFER